METLIQKLILVRSKLPDSMAVSANPERLRDDLVALIDCVDALIGALEAMAKASE